MLVTRAPCPDITADLSYLGGNITPAESFDGSIAKWTIHDIHCIPSDGNISIDIDADGIEQYHTSIISDNTPPVLTIIYPSNGIYFLNRFIFPANSIYLLCGLSVEGNVYESNGLYSIDIFLDGVLEDSIPPSNDFRWDFHGSLIGHHILMVKVVDLAGHEIDRSIGLYAFKILYSRNHFITNMI